MPQKKKFYLYSIINSGEKFFWPVTGIEGAKKIGTLPYRDIAAVISPVSKVAGILSEENVFCHQGVMRELMQEYTVLPVSFGTVANSIGEIRSYLIEYYPKLKMFMTKLSGKIEVGLKVLWKKEKFAFELEDGRKDVLELKNLINQNDPTKSYPLVLKLGQLLEAIAEEKRSYYREQIFEPLVDLSEDAVLSDLIGERMVLNASFLIDKSKEEDFDRKVNEIYQSVQENLEFKYSGPWPPYNFTKLVFHKK